MLGVVEPSPGGAGCDPTTSRYPHGTQLAEAVAFFKRTRATPHS